MNSSLEQDFRARFKAEQEKVSKILFERPTATADSSLNAEQNGQQGSDSEESMVLAAKPAEKSNLRLLQEVFARGLARCLARRRSEKSREELQELVRRFVESGVQGALLPGPQRGGDFLNNQLRGAWAEDVVCSLPPAESDLVFVKFGPSMAAMPGQEDHASVVRTFREIMLVEGKRPDLLAFRSKVWDSFTHEDHERATQWPRRLLSTMDWPLIRQASAAIEVKTSLWHAGRRRLVNPKPLSITVKVEEVDGLSAWSDAAGLPIVFVQVLFDEVYCLSFSAMRRVIDEPVKEDRYLYSSGDYEVVMQRKSGKEVHHFALYQNHMFAAVVFPEQSKAHVEVLPDGSVVLYMELLPAQGVYVTPDVILREVEAD